MGIHICINFWRKARWKTPGRSQKILDHSSHNLGFLVFLWATANWFRGNFEQISNHQVENSPNFDFGWLVGHWYETLEIRFHFLFENNIDVEFLGRSNVKYYCCYMVTIPVIYHLEMSTTHLREAPKNGSFPLNLDHLSNQTTLEEVLDNLKPWLVWQNLWKITGENKTIQQKSPHLGEIHPKL